MAPKGLHTLCSLGSFISCNLRATCYSDGCNGFTATGSAGKYGVNSKGYKVEPKMQRAPARQARREAPGKNRRTHAGISGACTVIVASAKKNGGRSAFTSSNGKSAVQR